MSSGEFEFITTDIGIAYINIWGGTDDDGGFTFGYIDTLGNYYWQY
jgi:hypothetical protein